MYCFLLALGIAVSMLRQRTQRRSPETPPVLVRIRRIAGVWIFYALIQIWNAPAVGVGSLQRLDFFLSLFGL